MAKFDTVYNDAGESQIRNVILYWYAGRLWSDKEHTNRVYYSDLLNLVSKGILTIQDTTTGSLVRKVYYPTSFSDVDGVLSIDTSMAKSPVVEVDPQGDLKLFVDPEEEDFIPVIGETVGEWQSDVTISEDFKISGTLHYIERSGFNAAIYGPSGNYLCIRVVYTPGSEFTYKLGENGSVNSLSETAVTSLVPVSRLDEGDRFVTFTLTKGNETLTRVYDLNGLVLEEAPTEETEETT